MDAKGLFKLAAVFGILAMIGSYVHTIQAKMEGEKPNYFTPSLYDDG